MGESQVLIKSVGMAARTDMPRADICVSVTESRSAVDCEGRLGACLPLATRLLMFENAGSLLAPVTGVFAAQEITPQARTLAEDRGIRCLLLDYDAMRGLDDGVPRLF